MCAIEWKSGGRVVEIVHRREIWRSCGEGGRREAEGYCKPLK